MNHAKTLVDMEHSGVVSMLVNDKVDDLKRMYDLFSRVPSTLDCLRDCMCDYVKKSGGQLVSEQYSPLRRPNVVAPVVLGAISIYSI